MKLRARELGFGYPERRVGAGVDLEVTSGRLLALLGPNGSGKTTLFKTLLGLLPRQSGEVLLDQRPISTLRRAELARALGYVPQASEGYFPYSVIDTVLMGRSAHVGLFSTPSRKDRELAARLLERLGIAALRDQPYTRISGGERQLTLVARALAQEPGLLILDEPTASLDFGNSLKALRLLVELVDDGLGVVLSTHDPSHALLCADDVALLHDGGLIATGSPEEVLTAQRLEEVYGVPVRVEELAGEGGLRDRPLRVCVPGAQQTRRTQ